MKVAAFIVQKLCLGCKKCLDGCPNDAIYVQSEQILVNTDLCDACEECIDLCMSGAITFKRREV